MNADELKKAYNKLPLGKRIRRTRSVKRKEPFSSEPRDYVLNFGQHTGTKLSEVPVQYLQWILSCGKGFSRPDVVDIVKRYLNVSQKVSRATDYIKGLAPTAAAEPLSGTPGDDIIDECSRWISDFYQYAAGVNPLNLKNPSGYRVWMDTCRKMQTVIDKDCGDHSQEAQKALRALRALLVVPHS